MFRATHLKRLCAVILIFLALAPALAARDDEIGILANLFNSNPDDDSLSAVPLLARANYDCDLATLLWRFDNAQVSPICIFHVEISTGILNPTTTLTHRGRYVAVPVGRAPPAA